ncbi:MAG: hypothetical protein PHG97_01420, partial [Candidatus Margulisbacteria bacterium]|nr:hypothetical protein [Candidatus Margulisiibacteriota bacterium]
NQQFTRTIYPGANLLGSPSARGMDLGQAGLLPKAGHEMYLFDNVTKTYAKLSGDGTNWNVPPNSGQPSFGLMPGSGYFYKNPETVFDWKLTP